MEQEKSYKACKKTVFWFFIVLIVLHIAFEIVLKRVDEYFPENVIVIAQMAWSAITAISVIIFPIYVIVAKYSVCSKNVKLRTGFLLISHQYVPIDSVLSVTTVITPLSSITGFNFVVLNSPGAKSVMSFLDRDNAREISHNINEYIKHRMENRGDAF